MKISIILCLFVITSSAFGAELNIMNEGTNNPKPTKIRSVNFEGSGLEIIFADVNSYEKCEIDAEFIKKLGAPAWMLMEKIVDQKSSLRILCERKDVSLRNRSGITAVKSLSFDAK